MTILNQSPSGMSATSLAGLPFWSFHLCARELDHLTPLVGFIGNEFSEICRRAEQRSATEAREPYLHFGVRETGIYFLVQFVDDFWRTPTTSTCYPNDWHIQGAGDFDGDGNNDVLWRHDSGQIYFWEMNGLAIKAEGGVAHAPVPNDWHVQGVGDFDGDGKSDLLWRHDGGAVYFWEMDGLGIKAEGPAAHALVPTDWQIQGVGDFDGDGKSDLVWRHDS